MCIFIHAQSSHVFTRYTSEHGFDQSTVSDILQDQKGFIWLATWDGIYRFDGYTFRPYKNGSNSSTEFVSNRINLIEEDAYGCIWALGYDKRISRLNPYTEQFTTLPGEDCFVREFFTLPNGHTWIATEHKGLALAVTQEEKPHSTLSLKTNLLPDEHINHVALDKNGNEWILTQTGIYKYTDDTLTSIFQMPQQSFTSMQETDIELLFSSAKGQVWKYLKETQQYKVLQLPTSSEITILHVLKENKLFCGTASDGFFVMDITGDNIRHYHPSTCKAMPDNSIKAVYIDKHGDLWIQQKSKGVTVFHPQTEDIHRMEIRDKHGNLFSDGRLYQIVWEDKQGNLFIHPTGGGFAYYDRTNRKLIPIYNKQLSDGWQEADLIMDVYLDKQDNIWISSHSNGLEKITFKTKSFHWYAPEPLRAEQNNSRALFIDKDKRLWIGFKHKGIGVYDSNHTFLGYLQNDGTLSLKENNLRVAPYSIMQDHRGDIWIGTKKYGIIRLEAAQSTPDKFRISRFMFNEKDSYSLSNSDVFYMFEDNHHRIWCATLNGGINYLKYDASTNTYSFINHRNELKNYPIETCSRTRQIISDKQGKLWIATSNGLLVMDEDFKQPSSIEFKQIKHVPGNHHSLNNNDIQFLYLTQQQELYIATFGGGLNKLVSYQNGSAEFESYTKEDGLLSNILLAMEEYNGNLWISMTEGLSMFNPQEKTFENYSSVDFPGFIRFNDGAGCYSKKENALLFNTQQGVLWFQPDSLQKSTYSPPIALTQLQIADKVILPGDSTHILDLSIDNTSKLVLKHNQHSFSINFSALDLRNPSNISYMYRLKGFEDTWNQAGKIHVANYTNIPKGEYIFEVRSTNSDGVPTNNIRQLPIHVLPSFWETAWAGILYVLLMAGIIFITVRILFTFYKLRHEVKMEKELAELKLQFFTNISHELRTPLTLISAPVKNILDQHQLSPEVYSQLQLVNRNTNRMTHLVNQILDFQKIQSRRMKMQVQQIELVSFLRHLMEYFRDLAQKRAINFSLTANIDTLTIWADADKLEKIFFNLISNAFKYTPANKEITIYIREEGQRVLIDIYDQGIGISPDKQTALFERFETILQSKNSTGIGLSLVKEFVDMHKGKIYLKSESGKGSTFTIELSKGKDHFDNASTEFTPLSTDSVTKPVENEAEEKKTMLIVEDNDELRYFLRSIFEAEYHITEAENGRIALEVATKLIPDIIISDVMMPEKDGIELLSDLRSDATISHIPFILLSAKSSIESRIKGIELGADDYITKPFSANYLKTRISNLLKLREKLQQHYRTLLAVENPFTDSITGTITSNNQDFMNRLIKSIEKHISNGDLKIEELAQETGMSRAVFFKKVKSLTGLSPVEYLKDVRMKRAAQLIKTNDLTISQIAYHVGFNDAHYFSKCFKQQFGVTPTEYREGE
ncbi:hybrid sensor histidine kinase/response regulator [Bacteroides sp. 224]|nr:hybrid sensor histidine kinase/response regulator [Bacteroides sp. 224]